MVDNFYSVRSSIAPFEAYPVLIIDANAVLASPIAADLFNAISGRNHKIFQRQCGVQDIKLLERQPMQIMP
jgi:hypothetical protein